MCYSVEILDVLQYKTPAPGKPLSAIINKCSSMLLSLILVPYRHATMMFWELCFCCFTSIAWPLDCSRTKPSGKNVASKFSIVGLNNQPTCYPHWFWSLSHKQYSENFHSRPSLSSFRRIRRHVHVSDNSNESSSFEQSHVQKHIFFSKSQPWNSSRFLVVMK